ncbi:MAG: nascent polypeptide-associated complex protein, partial [Nanoarchaeota archaeon]
MKINPRQMQQAMRQMGVQQEELPATEVIIKLADRELVIAHPSVALVKMMGQESFQISGDVEVRPLEAASDFPDNDVEAVVSKTGTTVAQAPEALE